MTLLSRLLLLLDRNEIPDHGVTIPMPMIGSLSTLSPDDILIVHKRDSWSEFCKTQTFPSDTPQEQIYKALDAWSKYDGGTLRITTSKAFLTNPSNPRPLHFHHLAAKKNPVFTPLPFEL